MDLEHRLRNWSRYLQEHYKKQTCGSAEKAWRSLNWGDIADPVKTIQDPIDQHDAAKVEQAWRELQTRHQKIIKWSYVGIRKNGYYSRPRDFQICRWLQIKPRDIDFHVLSAKIEIKKKLDKNR